MATVWDFETDPEYQAKLDRSIPVAVSLSGDVNAELGAASAPITDEQARDLIEQALTAGHLALTRRGPDMALPLPSDGEFFTV